MLLACLRYIFEREKEIGKTVFGAIYVEKWIKTLISDEIDQLVAFYCNHDKSRIQVWPKIGNIGEMSPEKNKLIQQEIDMVYCLGGDGTLLSLLRALYSFYSHVELPPIAAFNMGSLGYLCNFSSEEYIDVIEATLLRQFCQNGSELASNQANLQTI